MVVCKHLYILKPSHQFVILFVNANGIIKSLSKTERSIIKCGLNHSLKLLWLGIIETTAVRKKTININKECVRTITKHKLHEKLCGQAS